MAIAGITSSIVGGLLGDKFGQKNPKNYAKICLIGTLLACPFTIASTLIPHNFYLTLSCVIFRILFGECFWGPSMAMI